MSDTNKAPVNISMTQVLPDNKPLSARFNENEMIVKDDVVKYPNDKYGGWRAGLLITNYVFLITLLFFIGFGHGECTPGSECDKFSFKMSDNVIIAYMTLIGVPNIYLIWKNRSVRTGHF